MVIVRTIFRTILPWLLKNLMSTLLTLIRCKMILTSRDKHYFHLKIKVAFPVLYTKVIVHYQLKITCEKSSNLIPEIFAENHFFGPSSGTIVQFLYIFELGFIGWDLLKLLCLQTDRSPFFTAEHNCCIHHISHYFVQV